MTDYVHGHHESVLRSHRWRTAENSCGYLLPYLAASRHPGTRLLDVGCGPATITADLAERLGPGATVIGIDPSPAVIAAARAEYPDLDLRVDDVFTFVPDDGQGFDVVHAHQVLQHVGDPVGALTAMARLTVPDGLIAARDSDYPAFFWEPADPGLDRWREIYLTVTRALGAAPDAGRRLVAWARSAGLRDVRYSTSNWTYATDADRQWWAQLWADRTRHSHVADLAVATGVATADELEEVATAWEHWGQQADALFVVVCGELLARPPV